uniref:Uncharacterized protein n=1 Tax=Arundo donax TaxID=35708 RepID=A0A0A9G839_ARUDO
MKSPQHKGDEDGRKYALTKISFVLPKLWKSHKSQVLEQWSRSMQIMHSSSSQSMNILANQSGKEQWPLLAQERQLRRYLRGHLPPYLGRLPRYVHRRVRSTRNYPSCPHAGSRSSSSYWAETRSRPCSDPHITPRGSASPAWDRRLWGAESGGKHRERGTGSRPTNLAPLLERRGGE